MTQKTFPLNKAQLEELTKTHPTPFYLYDEAGIRKNLRALYKAWSIFPSYKEHFAVKALPNPYILKILREEAKAGDFSVGADCSSLPELYLAEMAGIKGEDVMLTANETPAIEYEKARDLGAVINLDDITMIDYLSEVLQNEGGVAGTDTNALICCRYNPGNLKQVEGGENAFLIGKPEEAKYGFTRKQIFEGMERLKKLGVKRFGLHTMVASNELNLSYHLETARLLFNLAVELKQKLGISLEFVNLGGGLGIPYRPEERAVDFAELAAGVKKLYDDIIVPAGLGGDGGKPALGIRTEYGRPITGPYGWLVARAVHEKHIYRDYIGLDACMADLMRPALYGAYHHITVAGKEDAPRTHVYDVVGSLCENNDKFAIQRSLPEIETGDGLHGRKKGDLVIIHDAGAHGRAMGFNYNGKLRCGELLLRPDGSVVQIRRAETMNDYFATLDLQGVRAFE
jgi:diaminopimelate decarboxylase